MPDSNTASYWLWLGVLLVLLVLGRTATHPSVARPIRHTPATSISPAPNELVGQKSAFMPSLVGQ
ncbi:hypothetical protein [Hymenobacter rubidus]|uniref:hypothetical protein n=1 Tax=Hymenobacter rubidus TaxID=1441626 RepID=UPI00191F0949|nr:hypothetical protein [Hymenobacter rubidus]